MVSYIRLMLTPEVKYIANPTLSHLKNAGNCHNICCNFLVLVTGLVLHVKYLVPLASKAVVAKY